MLLHHLLVGLPAFARSVVHVGLSADQADATVPLLQEEPERLPGRQRFDRTSALRAGNQSGSGGAGEAQPTAGAANMGHDRPFP